MTERNGLQKNTEHGTDMANLRQTILIRTDLHLSDGLLAAQCAHLHMERFREIMRDKIALTPDEKEWLKSPYVFIHGVPNLDVMQYFISEACKLQIPYYEWRDTIYIKISDTQRKAFFPVRVGVAFGPCDSDLIKQVIGDLPLL